ncbi:helix-turn-helix domain-containing protein [Streptomyces sp. NPDC020801]|uniref:helix-turn-helix domain-containing protein n=1 Tax=Streptomyces sp. NPDC020801 TaxID=3365093 RepID=UPI0037AFBDE9
MSDPNGPTVRRRRLGSELRRLRERAGLDQLAAANHLECSTSKISRLERGQGLAKQMEMRSLLDLYGVTDDEERTAILTLHKTAAEVGWWEQAEYEEVLPSGLGVYVGLEYDARALQCWELGFVPGLLQTADYARAVVSSLPRLSSDEVDRLVKARMQRQTRLTQEKDPLDLWAVIDESVLHRPLGGADVMRAQLSALVEWTARTNVTVQVYRPKDVHPGLRGSFSLLEFGPADPRIGYVDSPGGNAFLEKDKQVRVLADTFDRLRAGALDPEESAALVRSLAAEEK